MIDDPQDPLDPELLGALVDALPPERPSAAARTALLDAIAQTPQALAWRAAFDRFSAHIGALCDLGTDGVRALLDTVDEAARWIVGPADGVSLFHIDGGARVQGAICGFVRISAGQSFPRHAHAGEERTLVLAGTLVTDDGRTVRAGEELVMASGTAHVVSATADAELAYLVVAHTGIVFDGEDQVAGPDDPRT